jgi:hypothetical protein
MGEFLAQVTIQGIIVGAIPAFLLGAVAFRVRPPK